MAGPDLIAVDVLLSETVSPERERAVVEAFGALGVAVRTRVVPARRGPTELQWLILATLPLHAFLTGLGSKFAEDAYQRLKSLVTRVLHGLPQPAAPGQVLVLQDAATRLQVVLEADLPPAAYRQLVELDLSTFQQGPVHYDRHRGEWRCELDEWTRRQEAPPA
ncbi:MAG: hypothetical protein ACRD0K_25670 [Egibacteraceae bacterium]